MSISNEESKNDDDVEMLNANSSSKKLRQDFSTPMMDSSPIDEERQRRRGFKPSFMESWANINFDLPSESLGMHNQQVIRSSKFEVNIVYSKYLLQFLVISVICHDTNFYE